MDGTAETLSRPHEVFRGHYADLQEAVCSPKRLAGLLYSDKLISKATKNEVNSSSATPFDKATTLLDAVERTLNSSSQPECVTVFNRLCDVLDLTGEPALQGIAGRMRSSLTGIGPIPPSIAISKAIKENSSDLRKVVGKTPLQELNPELFASYVIQLEEHEFFEELRMGGSPKDEIVEKVASAIEKFIESNPLQLSAVVDSTRSFGLLHDVTKRIRFQYETYLRGATHGQLLIQSPNIQNPIDTASPMVIETTATEIPVPQEVARRFIKLQWNYRKTFLKVKSIVCKTVSREELKEKIGTQYFDLEDVLKSTTTSEEVMQLFWKKSWNFPYLHDLHALAGTLSLPEALKEIEQYEKKQDKVYEDVLATEFAKLAKEAYRSDKDVKIEFTVDCSNDKVRLKDFEVFLKRVFGFMYKNIRLISAHQSLLVFICSTPFYMVRAIVRIVQEKEELLLYLGVVYVVVAGDVVFKARSNAHTQTVSSTHSSIVPQAGHVVGSANVTEMLRRMQEEIHLVHTMIDSSTYSQEGVSQEIEILQEKLDKLSSMVPNFQRLEFSESESFQLKKELEGTKERLSVSQGEIALLVEALKSEKQRTSSYRRLSQSKFEEVVELLHDKQATDSGVQTDQSVYDEEISTLKANLDEARSGLEYYKKAFHAQAREIEGMKKMIKEARDTSLLLTEPPVASFDSRVIYSPPVDLIMENFQQHKLEDKRWTSPPFATHRSGYQMCLQVTPNGFWIGKNTHLCVAARLMKGEHDDHLSWPFRGTLTVQLINQKQDKHHVEHQIPFTDVDSDDCCGRVISGTVMRTGMIANFGRPVPKFIELAELLVPTDETCYLYQDKLRLRITAASVYSSRVSSRMPRWATSPEKCVAEFTMTDFHQHRQARDEWLSTPFFTHDGGYQLCISVHANGLESGAGNHVSVYVQMMAGPNDDRLKWPFEGKVTTQIVNWKCDKYHAQEVIEIRRGDNASARMTGIAHISLATGRHQFLSHEKLLDTSSEDTLYIEDGTIKLRITSVEVYT